MYRILNDAIQTLLTACIGLAVWRFERRRSNLLERQLEQYYRFVQKQMVV